MAWLALKTSRFFKHESCGKCTPCREGTYWMQNILERMNKGEAVLADVDLLQNVASSIGGKCLCPLGDLAATAPHPRIQGVRAAFGSRAKGQKGRAPAGRPPTARPTPDAPRA